MFLEPDWTKQTQLRFYTDASGTVGFGGFLRSEWFAGIWPSSWGHIDIQTKEIFPIFEGLKLFGEQLRNKKLKIYSDNQAVVEILNSMSSKSKSVMVFVRLIVLQLMKMNLLIKVFHIAGFKNTTADRLSRNLLQEARRYSPQLDPEPRHLTQDLLPINWTL